MQLNARLIPFVITAIILMIGEATGNAMFIGLTKPLLMPALALAWYYTAAANRTPWRWLVMGALFFSTLGDIFLMKPELFLFGLAAFLVAHVLYICTFLKIAAHRRGFLHQQPWFILLFVLYLAGLMSWLWGNIHPDMKIPVIFYAATITVMAALALHLRGILTATSANWLLMGALLFVLSDSLIAVNKFGHSFPDARVAILGTYVFGQYSIVRGIS